jgi:phytoene dehydrogenase-like protein
MLDAIIVGSGPNGLTAAVELARRGLSVEVFEAREAIGGGARTEELTLPGFLHDPCSAAHPLGIGSPAFRQMPLSRFGLEWLHAPLPMAHPFPDGTAAVLSRSVTRTALSLGPRDASAYRRLVEPFIGKWDTLVRDFMSLPSTALPRSPGSLARFGMIGALPATWLMAHRFKDDRAKTLFAGLVAHVMAPLGGTATSAVGLVFALAAHENGWPVARGGSQSISDALAGYLKELGGIIHTGFEVKSLTDLPPARAYVFDTSPTALARIASLGPVYDRYRYGAAAFKIDYALDGPVPWTAPEAREAGTVQIGASQHEISSALHAASRTRQASSRPFLITTQPSLADPSRAPAGKHTFWAYGHVPNGWGGDLTSAVERQLERYAPGFRDRVLARAITGPPQFAARNANYVGGDIACGATSGLQLLMRPRLTLFPYRTPRPHIFLCSQATPPGPGVHGMSGHNAAKAVWRSIRATD